MFIKYKSLFYAWMARRAQAPQNENKHSNLLFSNCNCIGKQELQFKILYSQFVALRATEVCRLINR